MSEKDTLWDIKDKAPVVTPDESRFPPLLNYYELDCYETAVARMKPTERDRYLRCMSTIDVINGFVRALLSAHH